MVWQDIVLFPGPHVDVEQEREARLAAQARAGADWALGALIARYQPVVIRYLTRLTGDGARAAALGEQIFIRMERRLRGPHGAQHLRLWLLRASTEAGLDALRNPHRAQPPRLQGGPLPRGLLAERANSTSQRLRAGLGKITGVSGSTSRQVRPLVWSEANEMPQTQQAYDAALLDDELDHLDPREALRHRLVRAVLAELPYGDAQCLALHLIAGLNQSEVAQALGIRPSAARHRVVQGLQLFARRYEAALASLGISADAAYEQPFADDEDDTQREMDRGEDRVIPRAASSTYDPEEDMVVVTDEMPAWLRSSPPDLADMPQASAPGQSGTSHRVITMDVSPNLPTMDGARAEETGAALASEPAREAMAIPVAESAIVGPIVDSIPVAADAFSSAMNGFHQQETQTLGYTVLVEQPHIVEATPDIWPENEPVGEGNDASADGISATGRGAEAVARVVPIISSNQEPLADGEAEGTARIIPVLSDNSVV